MKEVPGGHSEAEIAHFENRHPFIRLVEMTAGEKAKKLVRTTFPTVLTTNVDAFLEIKNEKSLYNHITSGVTSIGVEIIGIVTIVAMSRLGGVIIYTVGKIANLLTERSAESRVVLQRRDTEAKTRRSQGEI